MKKASKGVLGAASNGAERDRERGYGFDAALLIALEASERVENRGVEEGGAPILTL